MRNRRAALFLLVPVQLVLCGGLLAVALSSRDSEAIDPPAPSIAPAPPPASDGLVRLDAAQRQLAVPLPESTLELLRDRRWADAANALLAIDRSSLRGSQLGDWAFVTTWALVHADRAVEAAPLLGLLDGAAAAPPAYVALARAEVLLAEKKPLDALSWLEKVPADAVIGGRAAVVHAETLRELGRTKEAFEIYAQLADAPAPSLATAEALLALAGQHGAGSPEAYAAARRVWVGWPKTEQAIAAAKILEGYPDRKPTWQEVAERAEKLMDKADYAGALAETAGLAATGDSADACRLLFVRGRSYYKTNQLTKSDEAFADVGTRCQHAAGDFGPKSLYLQGMTRFRRARFTEAAATFEKIARLYPESSYADDGLTQAGISLQEAKNLDAARKLWTENLERFPGGDTVPESTFRLAWSLYLDGRTTEAREVARRLGALPLATDPVHVAAGRYWDARWALWPDASAPSTRATDPARRQEAIDGMTDLVRDLPHSFYAVLAHARLRELEPTLAAEVARRPPDHDRGDLAVPWRVRRTFLETPAVDTGARLARVGLSQEAVAEWRAVDTDTLLGDEMAWLTELRIGAGDWLYAHEAMRSWMKRHPPGTLGPQEAQVLRVAFPDRYWGEIQQASAGLRYDPRLLHALAREESNFNRTITSHAGARGLTQLMPPTAQQVAGWLSIKVTDSQLEDPATNAKLGGRYLDAMHKQLGDSPYLSLAAYNAGAHRVDQWLDRFANPPTDQLVESIPFHETRGYVKRVMGTWQTMRWQFDDADGFQDLAKFNDQALPGRGVTGSATE